MLRSPTSSSWWNSARTGRGAHPPTPQRAARTTRLFESVGLNGCTANFAHNLEHVPHPLDAVQDAAELIQAADFQRAPDGRGLVLVDDGAYRAHAYLFVGDDGRHVTDQSLAVPALHPHRDREHLF